MKIKVGDSIETQNANWSFSGDVYKNFDEHVERSVPLYKEGHGLICGLTDFFVKQGSVIYEIGSSTGTLFKRMRSRINKQDVRFIGIEPIEEMVSAARKKHAGDSAVSFIVDDVLNVDLEPTDLIVSYYSIQFIPPKFRQQIIDKIYSSLNWGGAFILFEKVRAADARFQDITSELYIDFKLHNGFTSDEIFSKARSLKGVLEPFSTRGNLDLLTRAGFQDCMSVMKYVNFEGFLAIK